MAVNVLFIVGELVLIAVIYLLTFYLVSKFCNTISSRVKQLESVVELVQHNLQIIFWLAFFITTAMALGFSGYLIYNEEFLPAYFLELIKSIPEDFWLKLGIGVGESIGIIILAFFLLRIARNLLSKLSEKILSVDGLRTNDRSIQAAFDSLKTILSRVTWLWVIGQSLSWIMFPDFLTENVKLAAHVYFIIALGILSWRFIDILIDTADGLSKKYSNEKNLIHYYNRLHKLVPLFRRSVEYMIYLGAATLAIEHVTFVAPLAEWGPRLIRIIGLVLLARVVIEVLRLMVEEFLINGSQITETEKKSRLTIIPLFLKFLTYLAYFVVGVIIMQEAKLDPMPVLAGAGVLGIAVGFGAQDLMRDVINGFSILFEGYYLVGDYVKINDSEGRVTELDVLNTKVRDDDGRLHIIRNGDVKNVVNYSKDYTHAVVYMPVSLDTNLKDIDGVISIVSGKIKGTEYVKEGTILEGIEKVDSTGIYLRTITKVDPGKHRIVARRVRKILMQELELAGIEVSFAHHLVRHEGTVSNLNVACVTDTNKES